MGRPNHTARGLAAALVAVLALLPGHASAQAGPGVGAIGGGGRSGPGARPERGPVGGMISGRMTIIGPSPTVSGGAAGLPFGGRQPDAMFAPDRMDRFNPALDGIKLPKFDHAAPIQSVAPAEAPVAPTPAAPPVEAALPSAALPLPLPKEPLQLSAVFGEKDAAKVPGGVQWRIFTDQPDSNGEHLLVAESVEAAPKFELDPGNYIVHAVYGLVSTAKFVTIAPSRPSTQRLVLDAGGLRLNAFVGDRRMPADEISFTLSRDIGGVAEKVAEKVKPGELLRVPAGAYHVISSLGDANANIEVDLQVTAGKLTDAQVHHKAAGVTLKLVNAPGSEELADTSWTILTPGGDVIRDSIGALPKTMLAEGDYTAIARHDGRTFQRNFAIKTGVDATVEVMTQ
ncbi:hypothetical protein EYR15_14085 [Hansschlegelia quercus]|uniref:Uncharacterized protein n=1 Tax=Hansschlegelia quercus TaxID=2528245 RepID=A0A4Q9GBQ5_9HYPH|nr:hypothetical protein EYR15_14085 [Hansschlegelia quercus]